MWRPDSIWIESGEEQSALARRVRERLPEITTRIVADAAELEPDTFAAGKRRLVVQRHRGDFLQACPAGTSGLVCCNYLVVKLGSNCPFDCSYCVLQEYIANNPATKLFTNVGDCLAEVARAVDAHPDRRFRIGTGELMDSLALDWLSEQSLELVPFFAERNNALLELKTKSACVDNLLRLDPKGRTVVSWSMSPSAIAAREDVGAASVSERIEAAVRVQAAGYKVGFHFDPLIAHEGWEEAYRDTVSAIFARVDPKRVAWVSLGSLRLTPRLKAIIRGRADQGQILTGELVPCGDGKERVWRGLRLSMYRRMQEWLRAVDATMPVYLCMESANVWERVFEEPAPSDRQVAAQLAGVG